MEERVAGRRGNGRLKIGDHRKSERPAFAKAPAGESERHAFASYGAAVFARAKTERRCIQRVPAVSQRPAVPSAAAAARAGARAGS